MTCLTKVFRMSYALKSNLTKLVYVCKEKNRKLKIFIPSLFQEKKIMKLEIQIWFFHSFMFKKIYIFFDFKKKRYSETLNEQKFQHEFKTATDSVCSCGLEQEVTFSYLFSSSLYAVRVELLNYTNSYAPSLPSRHKT